METSGFVGLAATIDTMLVAYNRAFNFEKKYARRGADVEFSKFEIEARWADQRPKAISV